MGKGICMHSFKKTTFMKKNPKLTLMFKRNKEAGKATNLL